MLLLSWTPASIKAAISKLLSFNFISFEINFKTVTVSLNASVLKLTASIPALMPASTFILITALITALTTALITALITALTTALITALSNYTPLKHTHLKPATTPLTYISEKAAEKAFIKDTALFTNNINIIAIALIDKTLSYTYYIL